MVTDKDGYIHLIQYLTEHLGLFEAKGTPSVSDETVMAQFEEQLAEQIIMVCSQNPTLNFEQRNNIIREIDAIVYDLEEILAGKGGNLANQEQLQFISEFAGFIKNLFDREVSALLSKN